MKRKQLPSLPLRLMVMKYKYLIVKKLKINLVLKRRRKSTNIFKVKKLLKPRMLLPKPRRINCLDQSSFHQMRIKSWRNRRHVEGVPVGVCYLQRSLDAA
jgi:hypothetical protein